MARLARRRIAATTSHTVQFRPNPKPVAPPVGRVPRVARLLALAHKVDGMIQVGELRDLAHAADTLGLTRARITQIMNLLLLAPAIQEAILELPPVTNGRDPVSERQVRPIAAEPDWAVQRSMWEKASPSTTCRTNSQAGSPQTARCTRRSQSP